IADGAFNATWLCVGDYTLLATSEGVNAGTYAPTYFFDNYELASATSIPLTDNASMIEIYLLPSVGINEVINKDEVHLFPNPTNGEFTINLGTVYTNPRVLITDLMGRKIMVNRYDNAQVLHVELNAPQGVYLVTIISEGSEATFKINVE
ncbi:MAG: T9SS type A sorting domain-containing protein, partial [Flavobacteriales bacterium]|nr:T9SS type A sorting domain-containing protein [Flavobacteriales bacterium]